MESGLGNKVVFVTGASGGIGRAIADTFAEEGARLALQGNRQFDELEQRTRSKPWADRALCLKADVADPEAVEGAMEAACRHFGRVDVCVANAGIWPPGELLLSSLDPARVREVIGVNLMGAMWTARSFMASLERCGAREDGDGASIVFTGSTAGRFGELGHCDYSVSKAGLYGLVRTLKNEIVRLDPYGRVNMVEPGWTVTEMARAALEDPAQVTHVARTMPVRQLGRAVDIARAVAFLSSPRLARHLSGEVLTVAGGMEGRLLWDEGSIDVGAIRARVAEDRE